LPLIGLVLCIVQILWGCGELIHFLQPLLETLEPSILDLSHLVHAEPPLASRRLTLPVREILSRNLRDRRAVVT
jgi:hypothetical protein